jgi:hypothetical protein
MKDTWRQLFRRLAAGCVVFASAAWSSAMCYAVQLAYDDATKPAYQADDSNGGNDGNPASNTNGWQAGDNGGFGFTPWNFDAGYWYQGTVTQYAHPGFHAIDDGAQAGTHYSNPFNNIGKSWAVGSPANSDGAPRYGRGFSPLQVGQTFSAVIDNPTKQQFYKGYFVQLNGNTGGVNGNLCNANHSCSPGGTGVGKLNMWRFEYFNYGQWRIADANSPPNGTYIPLFDTQTAATGFKLNVTRTGTDTYDLSIYTNPLSQNPTLAWSQSGNFLNPGTTLDWFSITFFNPATDLGTPPTTATDLYIRSLEITGSAPPGVPGDYNSNGVVDAGDYVLWRKGGPLANEVDAPGTVNAADYTAWRARFGNPPGSGVGLSNAAVPESCTFALLISAIGILTALPNRSGRS